MKRKTLISTILAPAILAIAMNMAFAQQGGNGNGNPGAMGGQQAGTALRLTEELMLSEEQAAQIRAIIEEARLMQDEERARARMANEVLRDETRAAIMAVLDETQQARFLELEALRAERWAEAGAGGFGGHGQGGGHGAGGGNGGGNGPGDCTNPDCPNPDCPNNNPPGGDG